MKTICLILMATLISPAAHGIGPGKAVDCGDIGANGIAKKGTNCAVLKEEGKDLPAGFEEAILNESADDQGVQAKLRKGKQAKQTRKQKAAESAEDAKDLPEGFEKAILGESAADQGFEADARKGRPLKKEAKARAKAEGKVKQKSGELKDVIAAFIKYNELRGDEQPESEDECAETASSQAEFNACLEMLGMNSSVVSSRHVAGKKTPGHHYNGEHEKSSVDFAQ